MANVTLSIKEDLLKESRQYAQKHNTSLNALIRDMLSKIVRKKNKGWPEEFFALADRYKGNSKGKKWSREDLYDV